MPTREEKNLFSTIILTRADSYNCTHLDAIVLYCEEIGLEMEVAATLVNDVLKEKLYDDAADLHYVEKSSKLPL